MNEKIADFVSIFFGFRKFIAWALLFVVAVIFRIKGLIEGSQFVDLLKNTFLAFIAANGFEYVNQTVRHYINSKGELVEDIDFAPPANEGKKDV